MQQILQLPLPTLSGTTLNLAAYATSCHFRLLDCAAFVDSQTLCLLESPDITCAPYAAISYPWRGLLAEDPSRQGFFLVAGAEEGGPINLDVLQTACRAALLKGCSLLWLDRLCLIQTDKRDKVWQIQRMHAIYKSSRVGLVLFGGLERLAALHEETPWASRAWTLQEALAPPETLGLFAWSAGTVVGMERAIAEAGEAQEIEPGRSGMALLRFLLSWSWSRGWTFVRADYSRPERPGPVDLSRANMLRSGAERKADAGLVGVEVAVIHDLDAIALLSILRSTGDARECAIWRCAWMRTSSRPVDMVFSIMGLFGVELDAAAFSSGDREGATIALIQKIMAAGRQATWMGISFDLPMARFMPTLPVLPETSVAGGAMVHVGGKLEEARVVMSNMGWFLVDSPRGRVDDFGCFHFGGLACTVKIIARDENSRVAYMDRIEIPVPFLEQPPYALRLVDTAETASTTVAVMVGRMTPFHHSEMGNHEQGHPVSIPKDVVLLVVEDSGSGEGRYHRLTFALASASAVAAVLGWTYRDFCVGPVCDVV